MDRKYLLDRRAQLMPNGRFETDADREAFDRMLDEVEHQLDEADHTGTGSGDDQPIPRSTIPLDSEVIRSRAYPLSPVEQIEQRISDLESTGAYPATGILVSGSAYGSAGLRRTLPHLPVGPLAEIDRQLSDAEQRAQRRERLAAMVRS